MLLDTDAIKDLFGEVFGEIYGDGNLRRQAMTDDGEGGYTPGSVMNYPIKVQVDACTERMRESPGYTATDMRLLILQSGVGINEITTNDEVTTADGRRWQCNEVTSDPARSYWECRGSLCTT